MKSFGLCTFAVAMALAVSACDNGSTTTTTPAPAAATITDTLTGIVPAAVGGVQFSSFVTFTMVQAGTISLTLTSAIETLPGGTPNPAVFVGLAIGTLDSTGTSCVLAAGTTPTIASAGAAFPNGTLAAGKFCIQVSDQTVQPGPVNYTLVVFHS
jgi:hypothetical protein